MKGSSLRDWRDLDEWLATVENVLAETTRVHDEHRYPIRQACNALRGQGT